MAKVTDESLRKHPTHEMTWAEILAGASTTQGCRFWPWHISPAGYPNSVTHLGVSKGATVWVCELVNGPKPPGRYEAAHSCGARACITGIHLSWKTPAENAADKKLHGTWIHGEITKTAKLTAEQVLQIRARYAAGGITQLALGLEFGVTEPTVQGILKRRTWAWL